jgi:hypothetical protein
MLSEIGRHALRIIESRRAFEASEKEHKLMEAAEAWGVNEAPKLLQKLITTSSDSYIELLSLESRQPSELERMKITALGNALGVELMPRTSMKNMKGGDPNETDDWKVVIAFQELENLLNEARQPT